MTGAITGVVIRSARPSGLRGRGLGCFLPGEVRANATAAPTVGSDCPISSSTSRSPSGPTHQAWRAERRDDVLIFAGRNRDLGRLTLLPGTRISGRVVDAQGKPVAGAGVKLDLYRFQLGHTISSQGTEWTFNADGDGRFATPPLPAGDGHFSLSAPGKVRTVVRKKAEPGTPVVDLGDVTLPDEMPVVGVVIDGEGKPAPGVEVIPDYDWENSAKTDKDGRFTVHGVGKDLKSLGLQSNDYFTPKPFDVTPGRTDLKLAVIKAYEIHGTAVDAETGKPVPVDTVRLCIVDRDPDDGHVTLRG